MTSKNMQPKKRIHALRPLGKRPPIAKPSKMSKTLALEALNNFLDPNFFRRQDYYIHFKWYPFMYKVGTISRRQWPFLTEDMRTLLIYEAWQAYEDQNTYVDEDEEDEDNNGEDDE